MDLLPLEPFVDPTIKEITQKSLDHLSSLLIALRRLRGNWMKAFEVFLQFLKKIEKQDPEFYIYLRYEKYLREHLGDNVHEQLYRYLEEKGYKGAELSRILIEKEYNEGAFINRLPKTNAWFLWTCVFYLYKPSLSQKFFWENLSYLFSDEEELLSNYRALPPRLQDRLFDFAKQLVEAQKIEKIKKRTDGDK